MATLFCVYSLKSPQMAEEYESYLRETKLPGIRQAPWCTSVSSWRIDGVLGPAVSEPSGNPPAEPPYHFVAKLEISDLDAMMGFLGTEEGQQFVASWSVFVDPTAIFTTGYEV